ncbi:MAG: hypothetical protein KC776_07385 [Myxococcales bacterium]|nr:hypothetical protein [Myxococcales bacterium]MCB9583608.1 hypothetical protein [Polyangiaceae bacterium]
MPSYVVAGTWVAHATAPITLTFQLGEFPLEFRIHNAIISAKVSGPAAKGGIIAGVLDPEEVLPVFAKVAGAIYAPLCDPVDFESIAVQVRATSDIMLDGSNGDPTQICNGISLGIGFDAAAVQLGPLVPPAPDLPDPCAG